MWTGLAKMGWAHGRNERVVTRRRVCNEPVRVGFPAGLGGAPLQIPLRAKTCRRPRTCSNDAWTWLWTDRPP